MSKQFSQFPFRNTIGPIEDTDRFLIGIPDALSPTGFSNYIMSWAEIKAAIGVTPGASSPSAFVMPMDGDDGVDGFPLPGAAGAQGIPGIGITGPMGAVIMPDTPEDPEFPMMIPGARGTDGSNGTIGRDGALIFISEPAEEPNEPMIVPGRDGVAGANGLPGAPGTSAATILPDAPDEPNEPMMIPGPTGPAGGGSSSDPFEGSYAPGSFDVADGDYVVMGKQLILNGTETVTLNGNSVLVIVG